MTAPEDIEATAGEYVLGTLDATERAAVAARRQRETHLDDSIVRWEAILAPLAIAVAPIAPTEGLFAAIKRRIDAAAPAAVAQAATQASVAAIGQIRRLRRRARFWEATTFAMGALAACLLLGIGLGSGVQRASGSYVAVLQKDAASPAFLVSVDLDTRLLTVRPVSAPAQPDKSYELWLVSDKVGAPKSLGVIGEGPFTVESSLGRFDRAIVEKAMYAVTLEQRGGSPTKAPTSAPLWSGHLVQATP